MLRLGRFSFINSLPLFSGWDVSAPCFAHEFIHNTPLAISALMLEGELDAAPISSSAYLENKSQLSLVEDFCIAAKDQALSVVLFSRYSPNYLHNKNILLSPHSRTSNLLLQVLCKHIWNIHPHFFMDHTFDQDMDAYLIIGNQALQQKPPPGFLSYDLASLWHKETFLPFVFAVFTRQKNLEDEDTQLLKEALKSSYSWGLKHPEKILRQASKLLPLPRPFLIRYFQQLHYKMTPADYKSLELFESFCSKCLFPEFPTLEKAL